MIDVQRRPALPARTVRLRSTPAGIELYYPPLRMPEVALPLALFGALAFALPALGLAALLSSALADAAGVLTSVLVVVFLAPVALFGAVLVMQAIYMLINALRVRVDAQGIARVRFVLWIPLPERRYARAGIASIEPRIPTRHQSLFSAEPVYQLVAMNSARTLRVVVAESLQGDALMRQVKALLENALGLTQSP